MKKSFFFLIILTLAGCELTEDNGKGKLASSNPKSKIDFKTINVNYPEVKKEDVVDDYHGTAVYDPYRWLENDNSNETSDWVKSQNEVTFDYLDQIPFREDIKNRLEEVWNYERYGTPFKEGGKYYYFKNDGLQNQSILYAEKTLGAETELILDPNKFSKDGTASLGMISFNKPGDHLAYQVSEGGSDWRTIYIKDLNSGATLKDKVEWVKFSTISWFKDGFFYSRYPQPEDGKALSAKK